MFSLWTTPLSKSELEKVHQAPATKRARAAVLARELAREQKLKEGERARQLAKVKAAAFVAMKTGKDLKTAAKWARTSIPKSELEKAVQGLPEKAAFQLRMAATDPTGELRQRPGFISRTWSTLRRETSRFAGAAAGAFEALLELQKKSEVEYYGKVLPKKLGMMTPEEAKKKGYVILGEGFKPLPITTGGPKTSAEKERQKKAEALAKTIRTITDEKPARKVSVTKSIVEGFKSPEKYDFQPMPESLLERDPAYIIYRELFPTQAKLYRLVLNLGLGIGLDPMMYVGIGKTAKVASEVAKLAKDVHKAEEAGEQAKRLQESLKQAKKLQEKSKGVKATAKERVKAIGEEAKRADTELSKEVKKIEKLNKSLGESYVKLQRAEQRAAKLAQDAHTEHWKAVVGISDVEKATKKKQLAEHAAQVVQDHKRAIEETQRAISQSSNRIDQLRVALQMTSKAAEKEKARVTRVGALSTRAAEKQKATRQQVANLLKEASKAPELRRRLLLAQAPRTVLRVGSAEIPLDKVLYPAGKALFDVARSTRPTMAVANVLGKVFRYGQPKITPEMTYDKFRELSNLAEFVHGGVAKVSAGGKLEQAATAKKWAGAEIPKEIREKVPYYIETPDEEILKKLSPEARQLLDKAADIYRTSMEEMYQKLIEAFGNDAPRYIENYVMHLYKERPEQAKELIAQWQKALGRKAMPGARPSFTKEREIETLAQARAAGYKPVEDVAVLDAIYRRAATQLLLEKELTDTLESMGYIVRKGKKAPEGWIPGGPIAPWLKGKYVHPEVAEMLQLGRRAFEITDEVLNAALRLYDRALTTFKGVITLRPMYHFMNFIGNMMLMRMAGVPTTKIPELYTRFLKVMVGKTEEDRKLLDTFRALGLEGTGAFREIKSTQQMLKEAEEAVAKAEGGPIKGVIRFFIPTRALKSSRELGEFVDTWSRGAMFLHYLDEGFTTEQAASLVRKYLGDYSKLTPAEREGFRRIFPFYAWVKFALPRSIASIVEHPGAFSEYRRIQEYMAQEAGAAQEDLPDWLQGSIILKTDDDDRIVLLNPQPPWGDVYELLSEEGGQAFLRQLGWMLTPAATTAMALVTGKDPFTGKPLVKDEIMQKHPMAARAVALLRYWIPRSELQQMRLGEISPALKPVEELLGLTPSTEPMVYQRVRPGLVAPFTAMFNVYDKRLDEAKKATQMSRDISTILRHTAQDEGVMLKGMPEEAIKKIREAPDAEEAASIITREMEKEVGYQRKATITKEAWQEATSDPVKSKILAYMIRNSANPQTTAQRLVATCPQLWTLPPDKFRSVIGWLFSLPNIQKVAQRVGHVPSFQEMLSYAQPLAKEQLGIEKMKPKAPTTIERMRLEGVFDTPTTSRAVEAIRSRGYDRQLAGTNLMFSDVVNEAVRITGVSDDWIPYLWWLAARESTFNPRAVNTESGATGLMQTKPATFKQYALPGMNDIMNPLHNMVAAIQYIKARYGHPKNIPGIGKSSAFVGY